VAREALNYGVMVAVYGRLGMFSDAEDLVQQAVDSNIFRKTLGHRVEKGSDVIDFHAKSVYVQQFGTRDQGIPGGLASVLMHIHAKKNRVHSGTQCAVGHHGEGIVKAAVTTYVQDVLKMRVEDAPKSDGSGKNPGRLIIL
jgi:pentatricopeptide repeat protein